MWREKGHNRVVIVANTSFRIAPWADALFAMDKDWWTKYIDEVTKSFKGLRFSSNFIHNNIGHLKDLKHYGNSGAACISLAIASGCNKVIMIGYDCQKTDGKSHWHGDHPPGLGNANVSDKWKSRFEDLSKDYNVKIINSSRITALECFEKMELEKALCEF